MTTHQAGRAFNSSNWHCLVNQQTKLQQLSADQSSAQCGSSREAQKHTPLDDHLRYREGHSRSNFNKKITWNHIKVVLIFSPIHQVTSQAFAGNMNSSIRHLQKANDTCLCFKTCNHTTMPPPRPRVWTCRRSKAGKQGCRWAAKSTKQHLQATLSPPWLQVQTGLLHQLLIQPNTKDCSWIRLKVVVSSRGGKKKIITCTDLWHQPKAVNNLPGEWKATASLSLLLEGPETFPQPVFSKCVTAAQTQLLHPLRSC